MKCLMAEVNISEGRDLAMVEEVKAAMLDGEPVEVMEIAPDADHNRTVFTFKLDLEDGAKSSPDYGVIVCNQDANCFHGSCP